MSITSIIIISSIGIIVVFIIYRMQKVKKQSRKLNQERFERIKPLYDLLESGRDVSEKDVLDYAKDFKTREMTFNLLKDHNKLILFPKEFDTIILAAESNLCNWLEFPTELDAFPDKIEHVKRVTIDYDGKNNSVYYEVFKFMVNEPHWAAKDGWMLGVVGPYFDDSKAYDHPRATFSRLSSKFDTTSPDEEAKWVHENISKKNI